MFNLPTGGEFLIILLVALIVLGPDKLPDAVRKFGKLYGEARRMADGFTSELRGTLDQATSGFTEAAGLDDPQPLIPPGAVVDQGRGDAAAGLTGALPAELPGEDVEGTPEAEALPSAGDEGEPGLVELADERPGDLEF